MSPNTFPDWLASRARANPDRVALVIDSRTLTFAELDGAVNDAARRLATIGVAAGDRVCTLLNNGLHAAIMPHAVLRIGATLVPLNTRLTSLEVELNIADADPRVLVVESRTMEQASDVRRVNPSLPIISIDDALATHSDPVPFDRLALSDVPLRYDHPEDAVLAIVYTSGTTGRPKGAMLTVSNFWWSAIGSMLNLGSRADDRWLACMPLFHVGGLSILIRSAIYGSAVELHDGFDAERVNASIDRGDATIVSVVAAMLGRLLDSRKDKPFPEMLRFMLLGGGPASEALLERCARIDAPVIPTYGLTEACSQVATFSLEDAGTRTGASGKVLYPNEIRISGAQSGSDEGEILVRGPIVMSAYFRNTAATEAAIVDDWLHTGDIGRIDADGYLHVLDRRDDLIVTGGENVYPAEVEAALESHAAIAEAGVVGLPDSFWGQRVVAIVRLNESGAVDDNALTEHCSRLLAGFKRPSDYRFVDEPLPRTSSGKLRRNELRKFADEGSS